MLKTISDAYTEIEVVGVIKEEFDKALFGTTRSWKQTLKVSGDRW